MTGPGAFEVDIVSDVVCPWCFVGKRRLDAALRTLAAERPLLTVRVRWHPYLLNPDTPPGGEPYRPFLERKFGGAAAVEAVWQRVREAGATAGVDFAFERIARRPPTVDAHRLIHRRQAAGDAAALVEALFAAHFQHGEDIGDRATLARLAAGATGEAEAGLRAYLDSDADRATVLAEVDAATRLGVSGVPFFVFDRRRAVSGAQSPETLCTAMRETLAER